MVGFWLSEKHKKHFIFVDCVTAILYSWHVLRCIIESSGDQTRRKTTIEKLERSVSRFCWSKRINSSNSVNWKCPERDVCRVFRHNLQLLAQHFHAVALMLIRAGNRGGPLCLLTSSPEKPPPGRSLCTAGSSSSACLFVCRHCERCGVYPGWG